jgi:hypothetical protein
MQNNWPKQYKKRKRVWQRLAMLSCELISVSQNHFLGVRQAGQQYLLSLTEYTLLGYDELKNKKDNRPWWKASLSRRHKIDFSKEKQVFLDFKEWLKIVMAREAGTLTAYEGIRIVRERETL